MTVTLTRQQARTLKVALILAESDHTLAATSLPYDDPQREAHWAIRADLLEISRNLTEAMYPRQITVPV